MRSSTRSVILVVLGVVAVVLVLSLVQQPPSREQQGAVSEVRPLPSNKHPVHTHTHTHIHVLSFSLSLWVSSICLSSCASGEYLSGPPHATSRLSHKSCVSMARMPPCEHQRIRLFNSTILLSDRNLPTRSVLPRRRNAPRRSCGLDRQLGTQLSNLL